MKSRPGNIPYKADIINDRLKIYKIRHLSDENSFAEDVRNGLISKRKFLLPKYFYDLRGSELFEKICDTEEYYPTRTEITILKNLSPRISERNPEKNLIVELGSGSSVKTNYILTSFLKTRDRLEYVPIDVSNILIESSKTLTEEYDKLFITGLISYYRDGIDFIYSINKAPKLILFLGSSIGNFELKEAAEFMKMVKRNMNKEDRLLIGFDLVKDKKVLEDAYNDAAGITAEFNLNILKRINTELEADFDLKKFKHSGVYNEDKCRIEMYLIAEEDMEIHIKGINEKIKFKKGEKILTENSYKFSYDRINELAARAGMEFSDYYTDEKNYFSLCAFKLK